jgi:L-ascorbate metabolism protein UlaG (beta-lactamase superfamily)
MLKLVKKIMLLALIIVVALVGGIAIFINVHPEFGGSHSKEDLARYQETGLYEESSFKNKIETNMDMDFKTIVSVTKDFFGGIPRSEPKEKIQVEYVDSLELEQPYEATRLMWYGHSAFLLQMEGKNILLDPMLGESPTPVKFIGPKRYSEDLPISIQKLPKIDAIIISHDHYDHLDYPSIIALKDKTESFLVPMGVGAHFRAWGVPAEQIQEFTWWDEIKFKGLDLAFTPSRHFSGRGIMDRNTTLWGSWVIKGAQENIYFSGDGGYGPHFKEIGEKYGPFDFAMMECGQYDMRWKDIHMMPEETAQAAADVNTKLMMPIHWGGFTLGMHSWTDPIERVSAKARELGIPLIAPQIGQIFEPKASLKVEEWWKVDA